MAKIPGSLNPTDIDTRVGVKAQGLSKESLWLHGPHFLAQPRADWPVEVPDDNPLAVPQTELRRGVQWAEVFSVRGSSQLSRLSQLVETVVNKFIRLAMAQAVLTRCLRKLMVRGQSLDDLGMPLSARVLAASWKLMLHWAQGNVRSKAVDGKLTSMAMWVSRDPRHFRGLLVNRG